jgi:hypothetical protein
MTTRHDAIPPVFDLAVDLGEAPPLQDVLGYLETLNYAWEDTFDMLTDAHLRQYQGGADVIEVEGQVRRRDEWRKETSPEERLRALLQGREHGRRSLLVQRMSLASPWEALLAVATEKSAPVMYGAAALVAFQRLLGTVMDWQRHRMDLLERRSKLAIDQRALDELTTAIVAQRSELERAFGVPLGDSRLRGIERLAKAPILRADLLSDEPEVRSGPE